jgi:hypothetical protein
MRRLRPACCHPLLAEAMRGLRAGRALCSAAWLAGTGPLLGALGRSWLRLGALWGQPGVSLTTPWHLAELIHTSSRHLGGLPLALLARQTFDLIGQHLVVSGQRGAVHVL